MADEHNNLDICFDSIFESQLRYQIEEKELEFVQKAIETLVEKLIKTISTNERQESNYIIDEFLHEYVGFKFICNGTENNQSIISAGSFYEETKNGYPDEFDYIYVICTLELLQEADNVVWLKHYTTLNDFHETIKDILTREHVKVPEKYIYRQGDDDGSSVFFDGYNKTQGPSSKLKFVYLKHDGSTQIMTTIDVDIVPAFRVLDKRLPEKIREVCSVAGFAGEIATMGSYLITNEVSFTETELQREKISPSHKMAYRLLKYIFNGCSDGERLRKLEPKAGISTYMIKVASIYHHFECKHGSNSHIKPSECVLTILEEILQYCKDYEKSDAPRLKKFHGGEFQMQRDNVEQTIEKIEKMLTKLKLVQSNIIATTTIKSISESILGTIQMQSCTGNLSGHSSRRGSSSENTSRRGSFSNCNSDSRPKSGSILSKFVKKKTRTTQRIVWDTPGFGNIAGTTGNTHDDQESRHTVVNDRELSMYTVQMQSSKGNLSGHMTRRGRSSKKTSKRSSFSDIHSERLSRSTSLPSLPTKPKTKKPRNNLSSQRQRRGIHSSDRDITGTTGNTNDDHERRYTVVNDRLQSRDQEKNKYSSDKDFDHKKCTDSPDKDTKGTTGNRHSNIALYNYNPQRRDTNINDQCQSMDTNSSKGDIMRTTGNAHVNIGSRHDYQDGRDTNMNDQFKSIFLEKYTTSSDKDIKGTTGNIRDNIASRHDNQEGLDTNIHDQFQSMYLEKNTDSSYKESKGTTGNRHDNINLHHYNQDGRDTNINDQCQSMDQESLSFRNNVYKLRRQRLDTNSSSGDITGTTGNAHDNIASRHDNQEGRHSTIYDWPQSKNQERDTCCSYKDIKGTTSNTHGNIVSHHYNQEGRCSKLHDQSMSMYQERSTSKNSVTLDTNIRKRSKRKKSRRCNVL